MIEARFAPAHSGSLKSLNNKPLTSTFYHARADGQSQLLEVSILQMLQMRFEIASYLPQGQFSGRRSGWITQQPIKFLEDVVNITVTQLMAQSLKLLSCSPVWQGIAISLSSGIEILVS